MENEKLFAQVPYWAISSQKLSAQEFRIYACLEYFHFVQEKDIDSKKISSIVGVSYDRVRRLINSMCRKFSDESKVSIKTIAQGFNLPDIIVVHFNYKKPEPMFIDAHKANPLELKILKNFISRSKYFQKEDAKTLMSITKAPLTEIQKAIVYTDQQKNITNPLGYLVRCFDEKKNFKYAQSIYKLKRIDKDRIKGTISISESFFYAVYETEAKDLADKLRDHYKIFGYKEGSERIIYAAEYHSKPANVKKILDANKISYTLIPWNSEKVPIRKAS